MAGSHKLARLLDHAAASRAKVVLVGDTKQLSSVDAGGGFRGLVARLGAHRLLENRPRSSSGSAKRCETCAAVACARP